MRPSKPSVSVERAEVSDVPEIAALYASAFADNAAYATIFLFDQSSASHGASLRWLFEKRLAVLLAKGNTILIARNSAHGEVLASVGLVAPDKQPSILDHLFLGGMITWPFVWGIPSLLRALDTDARLSRFEQTAPRGTKPHELVMMAVSPHCQGRGVGSELLRTLLERHGIESGAAIALTTQRQRNLSFYRAAGFQLKREEEITFPAGDPRKGFVSWSMERPPSGTDLIINAATLSDVPEIAALYASAFVDNPAYATIFLFDREGKLKAAHSDSLRWLLSLRLRVLLAKGNTVLVARKRSSVDESGPASIAASVALVDPHKQPGILDYVRCGGYTWPFVWGLPSIARALDIDARTSSFDADAARQPGYVKPFELVLMGVHPEQQGRGIGTRLMRRLLQLHDGDNRGAAIALTTQSERCLPFYAQFGFSITRRHDVSFPGAPAGDDARTPFVNWMLERPSASY